MSKQNQEGNYWLALVLSMLVLASYTFFLEIISPKSDAPPGASQVEETFSQESSDTQEKVTSRVSSDALSPAEGPFIKEQEKPTIIHYENDLYEIEFSTLGASLVRLVYHGENGTEKVAGVPFYDGNFYEPGIFGLRFLNEDADLVRTNFKLARRSADNQIFDFVYEKADQYRLTKRYRLQPGSPSIELEVEIENLSNREKHFPIEFLYGLFYETPNQMDAFQTQAVMRTEKMESADVNKVVKKGFSVSKPVLWSGLLKKYYGLLIRTNQKTLSSSATADEKILSGTLRLEPLSLMPGTREKAQFLIFAGPRRYELLKSFNADFEEVISLNPGFLGLFKGTIGLFKLWFLVALKFLNGFTHNFGWAIILLTLFLKGLFTPVTHISFENMKKMQVLQPKLKALQERHKKDPSKLNKEMMELYRRNKVNPMMGCLPMLLQIPIFIAFYFMLSDTIELQGAPWIFWVQDLSQPDRLFTLPFEIPFLGNGVNVLPVLMIGSMFWQQKLTPQAGGSPEQMKVMKWMPVIFGFFFYRMPSGLVLYWFVNNLLSIVHQVFVKRMVIVLHHEDKD